MQRIFLASTYQSFNLDARKGWSRTAVPLTSPWRHAFQIRTGLRRPCCQILPINNQTSPVRHVKYCKKTFDITAPQNYHELTANLAIIESCPGAKGMKTTIIYFPVRQ